MMSFWILLVVFAFNLLFFIVSMIPTIHGKHT